MKDDTIICLLKQVRTEKGLTQAELAEEVGLKRQAIYDIESGKYLPNTGVALKMARVLGCSVEELFKEKLSEHYRPAIFVDNQRTASGTRVLLAKVKEQLIAYPLENDIPVSHGIKPADALLSSCGKGVKLLHDEAWLEKRIVLMGCDPAFSLLNAHVSMARGDAQINWHFASTCRALEKLSKGYTHIAGVHLHETSSGESNIDISRKMLGGTKARLVGFAQFEEGLMVAPGNPLKIRGICDLADRNISIVNRESGAALRVLLDDCLLGEGISGKAVRGYEDLVASHSEGAQRVLFRTADAALGMRAVALSFGLDFVPVMEVRSDLVIPEAFLEHQTVKILLDIMQSRAFREELSMLAGYETRCTGKIIGKI
ncbi:Transcriptional regulator of molybdate metabolism, XRE family [Desulfamplus magnetovallimortis]|uniref:Transcriptional regulator of molybdate metabolism, XRE family n=1 Tax=Desulfamplus magnetovallimortis TaxID=1246637 RepID=A0A1W1H6L5_9BACT|nr:substrate-binding domain-containing protein [Desulfamplus magnetovallimortis]SLM28084.1 Transcriptional regulator of molybdate metabolism, XRE family [Desulfamplus magnetovallimortis]